MRYFLLGIVLTFLLCKTEKKEIKEIYRFPITIKDTIKDVHVFFDKDITWDNNGSFRIEVSKAYTIYLFTIKKPSLKDARVICEAKVKGDDIKGMAYLQIEYLIPGKGIFFAKGDYNPCMGTHDWLKKEVKFCLGKDEQPEYLKIGIVFTGGGRLWIDDIRLYIEK